MNKHIINNSVIIRKAIPADLPQILKCSKTSDRFSISEYSDGFDEDDIRFWITDSRAIVIVATNDSKLIGFAYGVAISPKWFFFDAFLIIPEFQNIGVGNKMYKYLRGLCIERKMTLIQGLVKNSTNSALGYWIKQGYTRGCDLIWVEDRLNKK
ncbi:MAG: GNAT family N-acetyltransferase [bacterium]|nr:GNAT family N-acetyltransferase [bacterium]